MKAEKQSEYIKEIIEYTKKGCHVFDGMMSQDRVVGYLQTILGRIEELEAKAAKWDMIENLIKKEEKASIFEVVALLDRILGA